MYCTVRFEWDENKNSKNIEKHGGLDFDTASGVFNDPNLVIVKDRLDPSSGEQRFHAIGAASIDEGEDIVLLLVVHVYRNKDGEEIIRIISARKASNRERGLYFQ
jgi:uncharacterized protein